MKFLQLVLVILSLTFSGHLYAEEMPDETLALKIPSGTDITVERFGDGSNRVLWLPSENGLNAAQTYPLARKLAESGLQAWLADLHSSYFLTPGRSSLTDISPKDIAELIRQSLPETGTKETQPKLHVLTSGRGAALALLALQNRQESAIDDPRFGGLVLVSPNLSSDTPEPGQEEAWLPVVIETRAPIFILQPEKSGKRWYLQDLVNKLQSGGSVVYSKLIKNVGDGYLNRPERTAEEIEEAQTFPDLLQQALGTLASAKLEPPEPASAPVAETPTAPEAAEENAHDKNSGWEISEMKDGLQPFPGNEPAPALKLTDMDGKTHELNDYRGKVVLLNFWATWCPPCIKEIPSLGKLQKKFSQEDFVVLSVDMGESEADVAMFLEQFPADYPVMLDPEGTTVKDWKLRAYPTTFVIDREGYIRLAYFGGLEWDEQDVVDTLVKEMKLAAK